MDLIRIIQELQQERSKLDAIIKSLEQLETGDVDRPIRVVGRRGRRSMDVEGRLEVSQRMKKYWEERRKGQGASGAAASGARVSAATSFNA